jgi:sugar lactone lactonase YvrE
MRKIIALSTVVALMLAPVGVAAQDEVATEPYSPEDGVPLWRASILNGSNGTYVGPDGSVYAASVGGDEITVQDPDTGEVLDRIGPERGVHGPDDVFVTEDGTIYWTELVAGNVGMLKPDGTFTTQQVGPGVNPITMSDDGRLFVARDFDGDGLYELDPELVEPPRVIIEDLVGMNGMDFGPDGFLYGPLFFGGAIARVDVDAEEPTAEIVAEGFRIPSAVKFDSSGQLHVVDLAEGQILKVDMDGGEHEVLIDIEGTLDNMAFDAADRIFTAASSDGQILRLSPGGEVEALNEAGWPAPSGVAVTPDGTVWVAADPFSIRGIGADGELATSFYDRFDPPGMEPATGFSLSADGDNLITTSSFSNVVQVFDPATGAVIEDIRTLAVPLNAIRHGDALVAAQGGLPDGNNVVNATTGEELIGGLALPTGLASDGDTLYVADWAQGTVFAVAPGGEAVPLATELAFPEGLAIDGDRLLVVEEGLDRVSAIDLASGTVTPVIEGLDLGERVIPGTFPFGAITGVAVGPNGSIFVTEDVTNTVYEFTR